MRIYGRSFLLYVVAFVIGTGIADETELWEYSTLISSLSCVGL